MNSGTKVVAQIFQIAWIVLAVAVVSAQPVASLAWLGGAHVTFEQAAFHKEAIEHGHHDHHGVSYHGVSYRGYSQVDRTLCKACGPDAGQFAPATPELVFGSAGVHKGPFKDITQATLPTSSGSSLPGDAPRRSFVVFPTPEQHFPPVPHRPPEVAAHPIT